MVFARVIPLRGEISSPREGEKYFRLKTPLKLNYIDIKNIKHRVNFDNLTPLYPSEKLNLEVAQTTKKQDMTTRIIELVAPYWQGTTLVNCSTA